MRDIYNLTEDEINEFPWGRELDDLIHRYVFGRSVLFGSPRYSQYFKHAILIRPQLEAHGWHQISDQDRGENYKPSQNSPARFVVIGFDGVANPWGWADTIAMAYCRFGLKAVIYRAWNNKRGTDDRIYRP